jgi:hypothetical protein
LWCVATAAPFAARARVGLLPNTNDRYFAVAVNAREYEDYSRQLIMNPLSHSR